MTGRRIRALGALLTALFSVYVLLDTFVIQRGCVQAQSAEDYLFAAASEAQNGAEISYAAASDAQNGAEIPYAAASETQNGAEGIYAAALAAPCAQSAQSATEGTLRVPADAEVIGSYEAEGVAITLFSFRYEDTQIYAAEVLTDSAQHLKTALAGDLYGRNVTDKTSSIAASAGAVLAINGDFYGARESGYVIRNGVLYRDTPSGAEILVIRTDGSFEILSDGEKSAEELLADGAWQVFAFGPGLVVDGAVSVAEGQEVGRAKASNPRTAVGILGQGHYLFLVSDGRTDESEGLSLSQLAELMADMGCTHAYNLDGGGSSTMVFLGRVVNNPTTNGRKISERSVSDIVYIG